MRLRSVLAAGVFTLAFLTAATTPVPKTPWIDLTTPGLGATDCNGVLLVAFVRYDYKNTWVMGSDDGSWSIQIHETSGRNQPGGRWIDVDTVPGGENRLRWEGLNEARHNGTHFNRVRLIGTRNKIKSIAVSPTNGCPIQ